MNDRVPPKRTTLPLAMLARNPRNPNVTPNETLHKIQRNIKRTGLYPPILVRTAVNGRHEIIDGHHRAIVLERLGYVEAQVEIWEVSDTEADVMVATLNTLHGADDRKLRAALVAALLNEMSPADLAKMLPENLKEIKDLAAEANADLEAMSSMQTQEIPEQEKGQQKHFYLFPSQAVIVDQALEHIKAREQLRSGKNADGMALYYMAVEYLNGVEYEIEQKSKADKEPPIGSGGR
jgi:ParB-like chromosome segregation protein Spo0J